MVLVHKISIINTIISPNFPDTGTAKYINKIKCIINIVNKSTDTF